MATTLSCAECAETFPRARTGKPARYCSKRCRNRAHYRRNGAVGRKRRVKPTPEQAKARKREYDWGYYRFVHSADPEAVARKRQYQTTYYQRPEVRERYRIRWHNDPAYRARQMARRRSGPPVPIPAPYTGHRWLEMARRVVRPNRDLDSSKPWADDYHDEMGEAVLALLEGRDMHEAVRAFRSKEYVPRRLTARWGDFRDDDGEDRWFDRQMPTEPSAEEEVEAREAVALYAETRFRDVHTKRRRMKQRTGTPSNRKSNRR